MCPGSPPGTNTASRRGIFWKTSSHSFNNGSVLTGLVSTGSMTGNQSQTSRPKLLQLSDMDANISRRRGGEVRAVAVVVGAWRDEFDGVRAENR